MDWRNLRSEQITSYVLLSLFFWLTACSSPPGTPTTSPITAASPTTSATPSPSAVPSLTPTLTPTPQPSPTSLPQTGDPSIGDPYAPELGNSGYDVLHYDLHFRLDPARAYIDASARLRLASELDQLTQFSLDFGPLEVEALRVDGIPALYTHQDHKLVIELRGPIERGEEITVEIEYSGPAPRVPSPYVPFLGHTGLYFTGNTIFSLSEPDGAHHWFPCNNHPRDKATFHFKITVPQGLTGVANGMLVETTQPEPGWSTFVWEHDFPMAPYLAVLAVGNYELIEDRSPGGIPIRHYIYPDLREQFLEVASITGEALDWMETLYGPYPFEAFGFVTSRLVSMASETQTMVVIPETGLNEETVIHEIAHMWFGNWVSLDTWGDMWWKEGAAIYTYLLWQTRAAPDTLDIHMRNLTERVLTNSSGFPLNNLPNSQLLGYDSYWRGTILFHALRVEVGDEAFFSGLRTLIEHFGGRTLSLADFQAIMEAAGGVPLDAFFQQWLAGEN
jgi:aminopeptidase N